MFKSLSSGVSTPIAIIIIIVCALLVGGIVVWQYLELPKGQKKISDEAVLEDETANWKTYRNEEYGFEIKCPKSWYTYDAMEGLVVISTFSYNKYEEYYERIETKRLGESYGLVYVTFPDEPLEEFFELTKNGIESLKKPSSGYRIEKFVTEDITIEEMKGYRIYYSGRSFMRFEEGEESVNIVYLFPAKEKEEIIRFEGSFKGKNGEKFARDLDQMLSTFRFLE